MAWSSGQSLALSPFVKNRNKAALAKYWFALDRLIRYSEQLMVNCYGDSVTSGSGVGGAANANGERNSLSALFAQKFQQLGFDAYHFKHGNLGTSGAVTTFDPRYSFAGTWTTAYTIPGSSLLKCTSNAGSVTFTPGYSWDVCNVLYVQDTSGNGGGGNMTITVDGGATNFSTPSSGGSISSQVISQSGATTMTSIVVTAASAGAHTITVTNGASGNIQMFGFEPYLSTTRSVIVRNMGAPGYTAGNLVGSSLGQQMMYQTCLTGHLQLLNIGSNDSRTPTNLTTYDTNVSTIIASLTALSNSSVLYWTWPPEHYSDTARSTQQSYVDRFIQNAGVTYPILDLWRWWDALGGYDAIGGTGGWYSDTIHPNAIGTKVIADALWDVAHPDWRFLQ